MNSERFVYDMNKYSNIILYFDCCVYFRRLSLPTVHFDGGGAWVLVFPVPCVPSLFIIPLDYDLREIWYDMNKYSNIILYFDCCVYFRRLSLIVVYTSAVYL